MYIHKGNNEQNARSPEGSILSWSRSQLVECSLDFFVPRYSSRHRPGRLWAAVKPMELPGEEVTVEEDKEVAEPAACWWGQA